MGKQKNIQSRWRLINNLFISLIVIVLSILIIREYQIFRTNIEYFNESLYDSAIHELEHEVDNRVEEIESVKKDVDLQFRNNLEKIVKDVDFFASNSIRLLDPLATLEEKRETYIDTIYQYDVFENEYLFFAMDLEGNSYLSGLTKNLEGTNISYLQDVVTGSYFVLEMIDIINSSEDKQGFITYHWMKQADGDHLKKTSFIYYNEEIQLFIGTGLYEIDYIEQVQNELFNRIGSYYSGFEDYVYIVSYAGDIIYHPNENFDAVALQNITVDGEPFHDLILRNLEISESTKMDYYFDFEDANQMKTAYIRRIDDWDMYLGKSFVFNDLELQQKQYFNSLIADFIIFNAIVLFVILTFVVIIKLLINKNFVDIQKFFKQQNLKVKEASFRDSLTGLYNRNYFDTALSNIDTEQQIITVFMIDANGLKLINDVYGHSAGDELLVALADTLESVFPDETIFRWGGDEFIVLQLNNEYQPEEYIDRFQKLAATVKIKNIDLSASIGFAVSTNKEDDIYKVINQAEVMMYKNKTFESLSTKRTLIDNILNTLYNSFEFEETHSKSVMNYCLKIGEMLHLNKDEVDRLRLAALMHDVGKIGLPDNIIKKITTLTDKEYEIIKQHPEKGMRILSAYPELSEFGNYSFTHHERFDGTGYPRGLKGEEIPLFSRIICVAEAYDAMTSDRTYKMARTKEEAIEELISNRGTQFDPNIVDIFIQQLGNEK